MKPEFLRTAVTAALLTLLAACQQPPTPAPTPPDEPLGATWNGGWITLADLETDAATARTPACRQLRRAPGGGSADDLVACYRETAEASALENIVLAELGDGAVDAVLGDKPQILRNTTLAAWQRRTLDEVEVGGGEVEAYFEAHRDDFRRPVQMTLWNIFRRHEGNDREATDAFLRELKARYEAGEPFSELAREHSQSETRLRGGLVGRVNEGRLPERLEKAALALADGEVSEPIRVRGGSVLLHVTGAQEGAAFTLDEVRGRVEQQVRLGKVAERRRQRAASVQLPEDARVLSTAELITALDENSDDTVVLEVGDHRLSAEQFRPLAGLRPGDRAAELDEERQQHLAEAYEDQLTMALLYLGLAASEDDAELRAEAEAEARQRAATLAVDERLQEEMWTLVDAGAEKLTTFYEDNRPHYQSALRFRLRTWELPFGDDPPAQLRRMEELREALVDGKATLDEAVGELGGSVRDLGTRTLDELAGEIPKKARDYLLQVDASGYSVPFQQDETLHLLIQDERLEPAPQDYEEVREKVREDYYERFSRELYRQVVEARLAAAGFAFDEEAVRASLTLP